MTSELQLLAQNRGRLLERITHQRAMLNQQLVPAQKAAAKVDRAVALARGTWQYVSLHRPAIVLVAGVVLSAFVLLKPGRTVRLLRRGFVLWRSWRAIQSMGFMGAMGAMKLGGIQDTRGVLSAFSLWATVFNTIRQRYF